MMIRRATEADLPQLLNIYNDIILHTIIDGIDAGNEGSLRLNQGFGFAEVANFKEVGWKFERWLDLKFLQLIL